MQPIKVIKLDTLVNTFRNSVLFDFLYRVKWPSKIEDQNKYRFNFLNYRLMQITSGKKKNTVLFCDATRIYSS